VGNLSSKVADLSLKVREKLHPISIPDLGGDRSYCWIWQGHDK